MENNKEVTDINVVNIKEDIERCKELIKDKHKEWIGLTNQKAIKNLLNAYKDYKNGKQELIEYYENKIQELEKENQELLEVKISVSAENTIQNLKRENIKLEERCFIAEGNLKTTKEELRDYFYNSIPKQKIKDKIKKLNNEIKNANATVAIFKIKEQQALQSLLEESEDK